jgi:hypothetical protein
MNNPEPLVPEEMREEYAAWRRARAQQRLQEECPHNDLDHGICLACGKDCLDDLIDRAEYAREE